MAVTFPLVTRLMVRKALVEYGLQHKSNAEIDAAMAQVDQRAIFEQEREKYQIEVWDKQTPINGVPAERVIQEYKIPENGTAYMIKQEGRVVLFQSTSPFTGETITLENAETVALEHLDQMTASVSVNPILEQIINRLDY